MFCVDDRLHNGKLVVHNGTRDLRCWHNQPQPPRRAPLRESITAAHGEGDIEGDTSALADASPTRSALPPLTVVTFATAAYVRWLEALHTNLRLLALPAVTLSVCAGDRTSQEAARALRLPTFDFRVGGPGVEQGGAGERFGTERYLEIVHAKSACIYSQLLSLAPSSLLWFVDGDVTLFGDPRPSFLSLGVDLALMADNVDTGSDGWVTRPGSSEWVPFNRSCRACTRGSARACFAGNQNYNSGFFVARSVEATRWLWRTMLSYHARRPEVRQQVALNELISNYESYVAGVQVRPDELRALRSLHRRELKRKAALVFTAERPPQPLTVAALDESRFLNGHCFYQRARARAAPVFEHGHYQRGWPLREQGLNSSRVLAVHHNYISGDELKFRRALAFGAIVQANDTMSTFLRRARASMECVPQWITVNPLGGQQFKFWRATVFGAVVQTNDTMQSFLRSARAAMRKLPSWIPPRCHSAIRGIPWRF